MSETDIEVVAITGLDSAIIGTAVRNSREVLAYDFGKTIDILLHQGYSEQDAEEYVAELADKEFDGAPIFIYIDDEPKLYGTSPESGITVH
tara:strand:+ start:1585 stop:1857 length:273 start_codon:yes stop_codon:yes gene_type:complete